MKRLLKLLQTQLLQAAAGHNYQLRVLLLCCFLSVVGAFNLSPACLAQTTVIDAATQRGFAQQLFEQGQYRRAAEEFQRFAYLFPDDPRQRDALFQAGRSLYEAGDIAAALAQLRILTQDSTLDAPVVEAFFLSTECYLQLAEPGPALLALYNLTRLATAKGVLDRAWCRIGWIRVEQLDWIGAAEAFNRLSDSGRQLYQIDPVLTTLGQTEQIPQKNPRLAGFLSIVPGTGQLYCGRYEDALAAFLVNAGLIAAAWQAFDHDLPALGAVLAFIEAGFYAGNIYGAVSGAHKYNQAQQRGFADGLRRNWSVGLAPLSHKRPAEGFLVSLHFNF